MRARWSTFIMLLLATLGPLACGAQRGDTVTSAPPFMPFQVLGQREVREDAERTVGPTSSASDEADAAELDFLDHAFEQPRRADTERDFLEEGRRSEPSS